MPSGQYFKVTTQNLNEKHIRSICLCNYTHNFSAILKVKVEGEGLSCTFKSCTFATIDNLRHCESFTLALPVDFYEYIPFFTSF